MKVQLNSDKNIAVDTELQRFVDAEANRVLKRFEDKVTRVEVHLSDVNSTKPGKQDKRCLIEARPAGAQPLAVTAEAATVQSALSGSLSKLSRALTTFFGRLDKRGSRGRSAAPKKSGSQESTEGQAASGQAKGGSALSRKQSGGARKRTGKSAAKKATPKKAATTAAGMSERGPKKKTVYRARRKAWPKR